MKKFFFAQNYLQIKATIKKIYKEKYSPKKKFEKEYI